jgi:hypothetical protein
LPTDRCAPHIGRYGQLRHRLEADIARGASCDYSGFVGLDKVAVDHQVGSDLGGEGIGRNLRLCHMVLF